MTEATATAPEPALAGRDEDLLGFAAGNLVTDPQKGSSRIRKYVGLLRAAKSDSSESGRFLIAVLEVLQDLRADSLRELHVEAEKLLKGGSPSKQVAGAVLIGVIRDFLTRRVLRGERLSDDESLTYRLIRLQRNSTNDK